MDLLHEWIGKTIEQELGQALHWRDEEANRSLTTGKVGDLVIEDDGSNLRVKSPKPRIVQIIKFVTFEEPLQATVSDGITRINVKFSAAASQRYTQKTKRSLTHGTPGGLIQLLDFEITATHIGPRPGRLTLFVEDFKSIGSNGSGLYGLATPHGIESRVVVKTHIEKLTILRKTESLSGYASPSLSLRSQLSNGSSFDDSPSASQAIFATQAPLSNAPGARISKPDNFSTGINVGLGSMRDTTKFPEPSSKPDSGIGKTRGSEKPLSDSVRVMAAPGVFRTPIPNGKRGPANSSEALLELLNKAKKAPNIKPVLNDSAEVPAAVPNPKDKVTTGAEGRSTEQLAPPPKSSTSLPMKPIVEAIADENIATLGEPTVNSGSIQTVPAQHHDQNPARKRISSRNVRIPKDQEALLDSDSSWLPAQPGHRDPVANIPISILQSVNRDADFRALRASNSLKRKRGVNDSSEAAVAARDSTHSTQNGSTHESDSDVPVSSAQWPPTPDPYQLPPDSNLASADHSDHSKTNATTPFTPEKLTHRLSKTSVVSSPILSTPPSPMSALRSPRSLAEPSPSVVSNSAGEGIRGFTCQAIGCEKTYDNPAALKYHIEFRHNDGVSAQSFKCNIKDCRKSYSNLSGLNYHLRHYHKDRRPGTPDSQSDTSKPLSSRLPIPRSSNQKTTESHNGDLNAKTSEGQLKGLENGIDGPRQLPSSTDSRAISPDSDLEVIAPKPLNGNRDLYTNTAPRKPFPSTASQPELPFTQVKRTPDLNMQKGLDLQASPSKSETHNQPNGSLPDSTSYVNLSVPSTLETVSVETRRDKTIGTPTDFRTLEANQSDADTEGDAFNGAMQVDLSELPMGDEGQNLPDEQGIAVDNAYDAGSQPRNLGFKAPNNPHRTENGTIDTSHIITDGKRKTPDASFLSPNISKRRKRLKLPATFDFTEEFEHPRDPSEGARQIRQEFLASRRSSVSSTLMQSPTTHLVGRINGTYTSFKKSTIGVEMTNADTSASDKLNTADDPGQQTAVDLDVPISGADKDSTLDIEMCSVKQATQEPQQIDIDIETSAPIVQDPFTGVGSNAEDAKAGAQKRASTVQVSGVGMVEVPSIEHVEATRDMPPLHDNERIEFPGLPIPQSSEDDRSEREPNAQYHPLMEKDKESSIRDLRTSTEPDLQANAISPQPVPVEYQPMYRSPSVKNEHASPTSNPISNDQIQSAPLIGRTTSMDIPMPDAEKNIQSLIPKSATAIEGVSSSAPANIYDKFKTAYPKYPGDIKHFVAICRKISNLVKASQMEHQSLWDDFIIRHKVEYAQYLNRCAEEAEDALAFEEFYRTEIDEPKYNNRVITCRNLEEVLCLIPTTAHVSKKEPENKRHGKVKGGDRARAQLDQSKSSSKSAGSSVQVPVIDLMGEDRRARHANLIETTLKGSPTSKKPTSRRSLPWSDHVPSPKTSVTQGSPGSNQHSRLKDFIDTPGGSRSNVYKPTAKSIEDRHDPPDSYVASIRSAWGSGAHDVLASHYFSKISQRQLHLMKDIAENVDLAEGRRLVEKQILSRSKRLLGEGASLTLTDADLEAVREAVLRRKATAAGGQSRKSRAGNNSSMAISKSLSVPQANAAEVLRDTSGPDDWWRDNDTPFKTFARAHNAIREGKGNSFAKSADRGEKGRVGGDLEVQMKNVDILGWKL